MGQAGGIFGLGSRQISDSEHANNIANRNAQGLKVNQADIAWLLHQFWDHHPNSNRRKLDSAYKVDMEDTISKLAKILNASNADEVLTKTTLFVQHLRWAMTTLADGMDDKTPPHVCGYTENPVKGHCAFHENFWNAYFLAYPEHGAP